MLSERIEAEGMGAGGDFDRDITYNAARIFLHKIARMGMANSYVTV